MAALSFARLLGLVVLSPIALLRAQEPEPGRGGTPVTARGLQFSVPATWRAETRSGASGDALFSSIKEPARLSIVALPAREQVPQPPAPERDALSAPEAMDLRASLIEAGLVPLSGSFTVTGHPTPGGGGGLPLPQRRRRDDRPSHHIADSA
jgi:hypothetical protein